MFRHNIRITIGDDIHLKDKVVKFFTALSESVILCQEDADDNVKHTHTHIGLESRYSQDQLRKKILTYFKQKGNEFYGMTKVKETEEDWKNLKQYICKGKSRETQPNILYKMNYTENDIETYHNDYWGWQEKEFLKQEDEKRSLENRINQLIEQRLKSPKPKRARTLTFTENFINDIELNNPDRVWKYTEDDVNELTKKWMKAMGKAGKMLDATLLNRQITGLVNHFVDDDSLLDELIPRMAIFNKFWKG